MLSKSSLQICSFRASPRTIGGCHHLEWYRAASCSLLGPPSQRAGGVGSVWQLLAVFGNANPFSVLTKWPPRRRPGREGDALGRVNTCCVCHLQGNIWEMPPLVPWTNALFFCRAARGVINCYCRESTECFSFNSKDVFNLPVALCKL